LKKASNFDQPGPACSGAFLKRTMQAQMILSPDTMAAMGIATDADVHLIRDADKLGIDLIGPEHDEVDPSDFVEVSYD
jgi:hypothetical protein